MTLLALLPEAFGQLNVLIGIKHPMQDVKEDLISDLRWY